MARASRYEDNRDGILVAIHEAAVRHGKPPTVRTLAQTFEVGVATMHSYLHKLAEEGVIEWIPGKHRSLRCTQRGIQELSPSAAP